MGPRVFQLIPQGRNEALDYLQLHNHQCSPTDGFACHVVIDDTNSNRRIIPVAVSRGKYYGRYLKLPP